MVNTGLLGPLMCDNEGHKLEMTPLCCPPPVATKAMNKVASHINEMQKLHEEYGAVFDQLINEQTAVKKEVKARAHRVARDASTLAIKQAVLRHPGQVADLSMGDLLLHCTVAWINPPASLVKSKKEPHLAAFGKERYCLTVFRNNTKEGFWSF